MRYSVCIRLSRFAAVQLALAGMAALLLPFPPAHARSYSEYRARERDYQDCARGLLDAGIVEADVATACSAALAPRDISDCVTHIDTDTSIAATDALTGCRLVRRPVDLATCVVDINTNTQNAVPLDVLDNCRRSLLPVRFSNCVVGVSLETSLPPETAMSNCIAAGDRPRNVLPSFVPSSEGIPTTPSSGGDLSPTTPSNGDQPYTTPNSGSQPPGSSSDQQLRLNPLVPLR